MIELVPHALDEATVIGQDGWGTLTSMSGSHAPYGDSPEQLLARLDSHRVYRGPLPARTALSWAEYVKLDDDGRRKRFETGIQAIGIIGDHAEVRRLVRRLGDLRYEPAVPLLSDLWRTCPVDPVRVAAGHALFAMDTPTAHLALRSMVDDCEHLSAHMAAKSLFHESPSVAFEVVARLVDAALAGQAAAQRTVNAMMQVLVHNSVSFSNGEQKRSYVHPDVPRWLRQDPRWIDLAVRLREDEALGASARSILGELSPDDLRAALDRGSPPVARRAPMTVARGDLLSRWAAGEYQVWDEAVQLGAIEGDLRLEVETLAAAIMERVARNADALTEGLRGLGWNFKNGPRKPPDQDAVIQIARLEEAAGGRVPISVAAFWRVVGGIDWIPEGQVLPQQWPDELPGEQLDPLVIERFRDVLFSLEEWQEAVEREGPVVAGPLEIVLAPDYLHKFDISGGPPYAIRVPDGGADAVVRNTRENLPLVPYLRLAFQWGGFVGLARSKKRGPRTDELVERLVRDLEQF